MEVSKRRERRLRKRQERLIELAKQQQQKKEEVPEKKIISKKNFLLTVYDKQYKKLVLIPIIIFLISFFIVLNHIFSYNEPFPKAVSLSGGISLTISLTEPTNVKDLEDHIRKNTGDDVSIRYLKTAGKVSGIIIEVSETDEKTLLNLIEQKIGKLNKDQYSIDVSGSTLGESFFKETLFTILLAFLGMGIVVFIYFRKIIPSITIISCAVADILFTMAAINILEIKVSTAGIAALLMLIGYSIDTDILLSTKMIKDTEYTMLERVINAIKPGWTMTFTTMSATFLGMLLAKSDVFKQIMTIIFIGLVVDFIFTWLWNYAVLRWYLEKKANSTHIENV